MRVSIYRVQYYTVTETGGQEVARKIQKPELVAAKDHMEAAKLLPRHKPQSTDGGAESRNIVITCQSIHQNVITAERLTLDEELARIEAT